MGTHGSSFLQGKFYWSSIELFQEFQSVVTKWQIQWALTMKSQAEILKIFIDICVNLVHNPKY